MTPSTVGIEEVVRAANDARGLRAAASSRERRSRRRNPLCVAFMMAQATPAPFAEPQSTVPCSDDVSTPWSSVPLGQMAGGRHRPAHVVTASAATPEPGEWTRGAEGKPRHWKASAGVFSTGSAGWRRWVPRGLHEQPKREIIATTAIRNFQTLRQVARPAAGTRAAEIFVRECPL